MDLTDGVPIANHQPLEQHHAVSLAQADKIVRTWQVMCCFASPQHMCYACCQVMYCLASARHMWCAYCAAFSCCACYDMLIDTVRTGSARVELLCMVSRTLVAPAPNRCELSLRTSSKHAQHHTAQCTTGRRQTLYGNQHCVHGTSHCHTGVNVITVSYLPGFSINQHCCPCGSHSHVSAEPSWQKQQCAACTYLMLEDGCVVDYCVDWF